jgi:hypothetical protein
MEIQALKLIITEQDVNALVQKHLPPDQPVENLQIRLTSEGAYVEGVYPLFINVPFETLWELGVHEGKVSARLTKLRAMGVPGNVFKSAVVKLIADAAESEEWLQFEKDTILVDVDRLLLKEGVIMQINLRRLVCQDGQVVVEAGRKVS